jgi:DNA-binding transcriptional LysR family regulator
MKSLKGIASFVSVASAGSFAAAAKAQGVSAAAVSKNVATLERQMGVRLFQRTTRKLSLTSEGQTFYSQCLGPLRDLEAAQAVVQKSAKSISGLVRITSASPFATGYIMPLIPQFQKRYPLVQIELNLDDRVSDMLGQNYDLGIRVGPMADSALVARTIAPLPFVICGSAEYFKRAGRPEAIDDLRKHNCLRLRFQGRQDFFVWMMRGIDADMDKKITGNFIGGDFVSLLMAASQGQGLVCVPLALAMPLFRSGQLQPVLTDFIAPRISAYLYYPNRKNLPARTRAFMDYVLDSLKKEKDLNSPFAALVAPFV